MKNIVKDTAGFAVVQMDYDDIIKLGVASIETKGSGGSKEEGSSGWYIAGEYHSGVSGISEE